MRSPIIYPDLGRAGLGNELFPLMRAFDFATAHNGVLLPPRWGRIRIGPMLRRERDNRQYWRLFRPPSLVERTQRNIFEGLSRVGFPQPFGYPVHRFSGMGGFFAELTSPAEDYLDHLVGMLRLPPAPPPRPERSYVALHNRPGDFAAADVKPDQTAVTQDNQRTALEWYEKVIHSIAVSCPDLSVVVCSDGTQEELAALLSIPRVLRAPLTNTAIDDLLVLAHSAGIAGSRSTFSSWGAFLGRAPMLVAADANAYPPHADVWEDRGDEDVSAWVMALAARIR